MSLEIYNTSQETNQKLSTEKSALENIAYNNLRPEWEIFVQDLLNAIPKGTNFKKYVEEKINFELPPYKPVSKEKRKLYSFIIQTTTHFPICLETGISETLLSQDQILELNHSWEPFGLMLKETPQPPGFGYYYQVQRLDSTFSK